jgi:hypothetical protein
VVGRGGRAPLRRDRDRAFGWLDRARVQMDYGIRVLKRQQRFKGDSRTAAILEKMNLPVE